MDYAGAVAEAGLSIGAIKLRPNDPFTWASGYRMPIYNDNRMFLFYPEYRDLITEGLGSLAHEITFDVIAGTSTAGIAPAALLANNFLRPLIYVRDKPKDHGLKNQIEGIDAESNLSGYRVLLIEDLISTGGSSANAVQAIRNAKGICDDCISIFDYELDKSREAFNALNPRCRIKSLLYYSKLIAVAKKTKRITREERAILSEWRKDPFNWGEKQGFPKVER
jgi:orotate phosphoribosyltransferase